MPVDWNKFPFIGPPISAQSIARRALPYLPLAISPMVLARDPSNLGATTFALLSAIGTVLGAGSLAIGATVQRFTGLRPALAKG